MRMFEQQYQRRFSHPPQKEKEKAALPCYKFCNSKTYQIGELG